MRTLTAWSPLRYVVVAAAVTALIGFVTLGVLTNRSEQPDPPVVGPVESTTTAPADTSTTSSSLIPSTTVPAPMPIDLSGAAWFTHGLDGIRRDDGTLVWQTSAVLGLENITRDGLGGLVFVDDGGLWWLRDDATEPVLVAAELVDSLLDVTLTAEGPVARVGYGDPTYVRLTDGAAVGFPGPGRYDQGTWRAGNAFTASITPPKTRVDSEGYPVAVVEPAHLVVAYEEEVIVDLTLGVPGEEYAQIHDFDGRTVIVSRFPFEPALPPETFFVIDLACGTCTRTFVAAATHATLPGPDVDWSGPVEVPVLGATSTTTTTTTIPLEDPPPLERPIPGGSILIATVDGASIDGELGVPFTGAVAAVGDGAGGLLVQQDNKIWWLQGDGSPPQLVVDGDQVPTETFGVTVSLMDGVLIDGLPSALYVLTELLEDSAAPDVVVHNLLSGDSTAYLTEQGFEGGVGRVSFAAGILVVASGAEGFSWFDFLTLDGNAAPFDNPFPHDRPAFPQVGGAVLSPDGKTMVYLSTDDYPHPDVPTNIVRYDMVTNQELGRVMLPLDHYWASSVDYDGTRVLVTPLRVNEQNRWEWGVAYLVDFVGDGATITELWAAGQAAFSG